MNNVGKHLVSCLIYHWYFAAVAIAITTIRLPPSIDTTTVTTINNTG